MSGGALATVLAIAAGLAGSVQVAMMSRLGEVMGLIIVLSITYAGPRIGITATVGILIAGQLTMGAAIDRWGLFGSDRIALHWPRLLGIGLLAAGAALSLRK